MLDQIAPGFELGVLLIQNEHALMARCVRVQQQFGPIEALSAVNMARLPEAEVFCPFCRMPHRILAWVIAAAFVALAPDEDRRLEIPAN